MTIAEADMFTNLDGLSALTSVGKINNNGPLIIYDNAALSAIADSKAFFAPGPLDPPTPPPSAGNSRALPACGEAAGRPRLVSEKRTTHSTTWRGVRPITG